MQKGSDFNSALQQPTSRSGESPGVSTAAVSTTGRDVSPMPSPSSHQFQQSPLQHYMMTGQVQNINLAAQTSRPQLLAHMQGLRAGSSPVPFSLSPQPLMPQGVSRLFSPVPSPGAGYSPSPSPNSLQPHSPGLVNALQRQLSNAGMMAVPPLSPSRSYQHPGLLGHTTPVSNHGPLVFQQDPTRELQIVHSPHNTSFQSTQGGITSSVSATGGTIHHHGHSPAGGGLPPLANPQNQQQSIVSSMNVQLPQGVQSQPTTPQRRPSAGGGISPANSLNMSGFEQSSSVVGGATLSGLASLQSPTKRSPASTPERPRKKLKLEQIPPASPEIANYRKLICDHKLKEMSKLKENYHEHLTELFFLQNGGNIMDYHAWKKRPTVQLLQFLKSGNLDSEDEEEGLEKSINNEVKVITASGGNTPLATPVAISTTLPAAVTAMQHQGSDQTRKIGGRHGMVFGHVQPPQTPPTPPSAGVAYVKTPTPSSTLPVTQPPPPYTTQPSNTIQTLTQVTSSSTVTPVTSGTSHLAKVMAEAPVPHTKTVTTLTPVSVSTSHSTNVKATPKSPLSPTRLATRQHSISAVYDSTIGSQEAIVERAKQEAQVMQRIAELRKDGLWSARRLPKVQEPPRNKAHWDYLLEEMQWLAADFAQERKWKRAGARKIARMISRHFQELHQKELRAEKEEAMKLKRIASSLAKQIKEFWNNIEKVVQYKQQSRLEEKRKKALDLHLSFIVDQTEKYSSWLTEGLSHSGAPSITSSAGSITTSPAHLGSLEDVDFEPERDESDDEETIEKEEQETGLDEESTKKELDELQKESEMPIEELLKSLPAEVLEKPASLGSLEESSTEDEKEAKNDDEYSASEEDSNDDEATVEEQEKHEKTDHKQELDELQAEGDMSMEELVKKYAGAYDSDFEAQLSDASGDTELDSDDDEEEEETEESEEEEEEEEEDNDEGEVGMEYLIHPENEEQPTTAGGSKGPSREITDIAATAESLQPTGYTLETTQVKTTVPFLLKHKLREYQHVGLDWLATLYERKLNGILADEMGLGKTIQTIALLAHLACEQGMWGPHLIVVPTSVMLNWEMEFKKWCPAFKILTYYGNQKERKQKRQGWTKTNAFHVCITSYKLVIQDHQSFRRKKWKYFILDEAQNIKNFKSQRWQTLLNFSSMRRLLLTGTPLQNSLMELWSLMHFLMPHVFSSHREFKEWFANPLSGMIEGSREYNENLIKRLHKVLRPFLLRRLKQDVEKQMPKKYEHVVMCHLSKRQRFLYDDFMSQAATKETLASGHFMSVINILMQLRKVCNHPNLFDPRPIVSPFQMEGICYHTASIVLRALEANPLEDIELPSLYPCLADLELFLPAFAAHRVKKLQTPRQLIVEIDSQPVPPPRPKRIANPKPLIFRSISPMTQNIHGSAIGLCFCTIEGFRRSSPFAPVQQRVSSPVPAKSPVSRSPSVTPASTVPVRIATPPVATTPTPTAVATTAPAQLPAYKPVVQAKVLQPTQITPVVTPTTTVQAATTVAAPLTQQVITSQPITVQIHHTQQGTRLMIPSGHLSQLPAAGFIQIVQTSTGQQIIATTQPPTQPQTVVQQVAPLQQQLTQTATVINGPVASSSTTAAVTVASATAGMVASSSSTAAVPSTPSTATVVAITSPHAAKGVVTSSQISKPIVHLPVSSTAQVSKPVMRVSPLATPITASQSSAVPSVTATAFTAGKPTVVTKAITATAGSSPASTSLISTSSASTATATTITTRAAVAKTVQAKVEVPKEKSPFYLESLQAKRAKRRKDKLERLARMNKKNCDVKPVYGQDLCDAVNILHDTERNKSDFDQWKGLGFVHCHNVHHCGNRYHPNVFWRQTEALCRLVHTPEDYLMELTDIIERYTFVIPSVKVPPITMHVSHPPPSYLAAERLRNLRLKTDLSRKAANLHKICTRMTSQFPELRLIQYDCGKLQTMDILLRKLKSGQHRVLIFTQMTRMLDVLEAFLNYHGHRYLRLDGTTRVEQRQALMERFNMDKRIFCFILSTRSGGLGVNLTGADTVIFYDSDWNPTMDAQAQDRCHRIGQTRDVHIYRLISEKTVEENILKKANQKRLLGDVAIEGGNFTTAFFKQQTIKELFEEPSGLESFAKEQAEKEREKEKGRGRSERASRLRSSQQQTNPEALPLKEITQEQMEQALGNAEDETDVEAARVVQAEQKAELAEFDETIPWDERDDTVKKENEDDGSKVEHELAMLEKELTAVERYAVTFMESQMAPFSTEELRMAEEEVSVAKEEWELGRLKALKEEEELRAELEEDEMLFTYSRDDAHNQVYISDDTGEYMPMWAPPTPPQDDNDVYIDQTLCFLYEPSVMPESQLPPVYVKKEHKRVRVDVTGGRKHKVRKDDQPRVPRSLFDRPTAALQKMRREAKLAKLKQGLMQKPFKPPPVINKPMMDTGQDSPEWLIHEDWALLQAVQALLELPLNLLIVSPAHIPNWDLVADVVNAASRIYRSPKQCKNRYENVIVAREEGRILYDINPRKQKKSKGIYKTKNNRPMRTSQLYVQDNNGSMTTLFTFRFDSCKAIAAKRTPTLRPTLVNPQLKNPKHAAVLAESGIEYDQPLTPTRVASIRAERIAREKKQNQAAAQAAAEQQLAQRAQTQQTTQAATATTQTTTTVTAQQLQPVATAAAATAATVLSGTLQKAAVGTGVSAVSLARNLGGTGSIVVNTAGGVATSTFATINKRMSQSAAVTATPTTTVTAAGTLAQAVRARTTTAMTVQELALATQAKANLQGTTAQVITTTTLTPAQLVTAQRTAVAQSPKSLTTQQQIKYLQLFKHQQAQQLRQAKPAGQPQRIITQATGLQPEQLRQLQLKRLQSQAATALTGPVQKSVAVTTPFITSVTQAGVTQAVARAQAPKQTPTIKQTRPLTEADMVYVKRQQLQQLQQQQKVAAGTAAQATQVHQVQVSNAQVGRVPQLLAQAQVSSVQGQAGTSQPIATLVKTVSSAATMPSVTIPVSAVSVGGVNINVSMPQQKTTAVSKATTVTQQQMHQIQLQQLQQRKALQQQKVASVLALQNPGQQVRKAQLQTPINAVQIIQQQHHQKLPVTVQQIQQIVKQQQQQQQQAAQAQTFQQIISSVAPASTSATILATQIVTQSQPMHKTVSLPVAVTSAMLQQVRPSPVTVTAITATTPQSGAGTHTVTSQQAGALTITPSVAAAHAQTTLVKHVPEVVVSPAKTLPVQTTVAQQIRTVQQAAAVRTVQGTLAQQQAVQQVVQQAKAQAQAQAQAAQAAQALSVQPAVQQAVQQVQAAAQQQAQQRQVTVAAPVVTAAAVSAVTTPHTVVAAAVNPQQQVQAADPTLQAVTDAVKVQQAAVQQQVGEQSQPRPSPYSMRQRNPPKH